MKIYDCFIYFDEDVLLDVRFNILDKFVDKFVIVESKYSHSGKSRKPNFNINNFKKYEKKNRVYSFGKRFRRNFSN